ncbi:MAG: hypothetical protein JWO96_289 [Candidatus Saccharibacteria bacterium]|nr:hypothetical protein [Candidatus Saccharibacteria bacterium]
MKVQRLLHIRLLKRYTENMLKLSASLKNLNVISLRSSGVVAIALEPIINPHNLKIIGWWCKSPMSTKNLVLLSDDIRDRLTNGLAINDEDELCAPEDLVRHKETLDINFDLSGKTVKTKRSKLGKVQDFSYNDGMFVQKLYVERPITKVFAAEDTLIIDRNQILEVTDNYILIKDSEVKSTEGKFARAPAGAA